jgi:hypothetical protein
MRPKAVARLYWDSALQPSEEIVRVGFQVARNVSPRATQQQMQLQAKALHTVAQR